MKIKLVVLAIFCLATGGSLFAQGQSYTAGPFNQGGFLYVCPVPSGGTPCPSPSSIFLNVGLSTPAPNPIQMTAGNTVTFFAASGQYTIQFPASSYSTVISLGGSGGGITSPANLAGTTSTVYVATSCPSATLNISCFVVKNDIQYRDTCTWSNGVATVTCPSGTFSQADVGKRGFGTTGTNFSAFQTGICNIGCLATTTISSVAGSTVATMSANATGANITGSIFYWGTNAAATGGDEAGMAAASVALGNICGTLELPAINAQGTGPSIVGVIASKFQTINAQCIGQGAIGGAIRSGWTVHGQSTTTSTVLMWPEFDPTTCPAPPGACFGIAPTVNNGDFIFDNWSLTGGGNGACGAGFATKTLVQVGGNNSGLYKFWANGMCANQSGTVGIRWGDGGSFGPIRGDNFFADGFGFHNCLIAHIQFVTWTNNSFCGDSNGTPVRVQSGGSSGGLVSLGNNFGPGGNFSASEGLGCQVTVEASATMYSIGDSVQQGLSQGTYCNSGTLHVDHVNASNAFATSDSLFQATGSTGKTFARDSIFATPSATSVAIAINGGTFLDEGGNTVTSGAAGPWSILTNGHVVADGHSLQATGTGVCSASVTIGLRVSGVALAAGNSIPSTCTGITLDSGVAITEARTLSNLIVRSSAVGVSGVVTVMLSHNGGAFATTGITCSMAAVTFCADGVHTAAAAAGDQVTIQVVTGTAETLANVRAYVQWN